MSTPLRVLIADDHPVFRHGIRATLEARGDNRVVGEATNGREAIDLAEQLQPDVVLMDIQMPEVNGIDATRRIVATSPHIRVLVLTMFEDDVSVWSAMRAGARGYVLKDSAKDQIVRAIQAVGTGEAIFSPAIANRVLTFFATPRQSAPALFPQLTEREREILDLIATGASNGSIAQQLSLTGKTVSNYISNIFAKLQVADRADAIIKARDAGLGTPPRP